MTPAARPIAPSFVTAFPTGPLTPAQLEAVLPADLAAVSFRLLQLSAAIAGPTPARGAHQSSGSIPPYATRSAPHSRKKRGAQPGHTGAA